MADLNEIINGLESLDNEKYEMFIEYLQWVQQTLASTSINTYMRDAGKGAGPRSPTDTGPLRIVTTRLSRSLTGGQFTTGGIATGGNESIAEIEVTRDGVTLRWGSRTPYADAHEKGFDGTVHVPAHTRTITQAFGREIAPREVQVSAHTKHMHIPARPYLGPSLEDNLQKLENELADRFVSLIIQVIPQ